MRLFVLSSLAVLLGTSAGVSLTWYEFSRVENEFNTRELLAGDSSKPLPKAVVEGSEQFDFGTLHHQESGDHVFVIRNEGTALLELTLHHFSCGQCVETTFQKASVQPGHSVEVPVTYHTRKEGPNFAERIELATNDPTKEVLSLQIRGYVTKPSRVSVPRLVLGNVSANEATTTTFQVYGYFSDQLQIVSHQFQNPQTAEFFELESRPLEAGDFADEKHANVAAEVTVRVKSGLPLGPINQTIQLEVQTKDKSTFEIPVEGTVVSDITLVGNSRLDSENNVLRLGAVPRAEGAKADLRVLVKGPYREDVQLTIGELDPSDVLRATIGEPRRIAQGAILLFPLTIEVVKDARVINRLGTEQGPSGRVIINTTHPQAKQVNLRVRFATE